MHAHSCSVRSGDPRDDEVACHLARRSVLLTETNAAMHPQWGKASNTLLRSRGSHLDLPRRSQLVAAPLRANKLLEFAMRRRWHGDGTRGLGFGLTDAETAEVQRRVRGGEMRRRCSKTVQRVLRRTGGIKPRGQLRAPLRVS